MTLEEPQNEPKMSPKRTSDDVMFFVSSSWWSYDHHDDIIMMIASSWRYHDHDSRTIIFWPKTPQKSGPRPSNWTSLGPIRTVSMRLVVLSYSRGLGTSKMMSFLRFLCREKMKIFKNHLRTSDFFFFYQIGVADFIFLGPRGWERNFNFSAEGQKTPPKGTLQGPLLIPLGDQSAGAPKGFQLIPSELYHPEGGMRITHVRRLPQGGPWGEI